MFGRHRFNLRLIKQLCLIAVSHPRLGHAASPVDKTNCWEKICRRLDYVLELANEARADPSREATTVVIGLHPFVVGTPDGAAAMRRVLSRFKKDDAVWLADTENILKAAGVTGR